MWVPAKGSDVKLIYSNKVKAILPSGTPSSYITNAAAGTYNATQVEGIPIFMRIDIITWNGTTWQYPIVPGTSSTTCPDGIIYITPDWQTLPNILSTGYTLPATFNVSAKDRIRISFSGGAFNNGANSAYTNNGTTLNASSDCYSKLTVSQDPFTNGTAGNPGPYLTYKEFGSTAHSNPNGDTLNDQVTSLNGTQLNTDYPGSALVHDYGFEFIVTDDLTIEWTLTTTP